MATQCRADGGIARALPGRFTSENQDLVFATELANAPVNFQIANRPDRTATFNTRFELAVWHDKRISAARMFRLVARFINNSFAATRAVFTYHVNGESVQLGTAALTDIETAVVGPIFKTLHTILLVADHYKVDPVLNMRSGGDERREHLERPDTRGSLQPPRGRPIQVFRRDSAKWRERIHRALEATRATYHPHDGDVLPDPAVTAGLTQEQIFDAVPVGIADVVAAEHGPGRKSGKIHPPPVSQTAQLQSNALVAWDRIAKMNAGGVVWGVRPSHQFFYLSGVGLSKSDDPRVLDVVDGPRDCHSLDSLDCANRTPQPETTEARQVVAGLVAKPESVGFELPTKTS